MTVNTGMVIDVLVGSKETLLIDLDDALNNLSDLSVAGAEFKVNAKRTGTLMQNWSAIQTYLDKPMRAGCLVDTSMPGNWATGRYEIRLRFTSNLDTPIVGPFEFSVNP